MSGLKKNQCNYLIKESPEICPPRKASQCPFLYSDIKPSNLAPFRRYTAPFQGLAIIAPRSTTPWEAGMNVSWWFILKSTRWLYINWFLAVFAPTDYPEEPPDLVVGSKKRVAQWEAQWNEADATLSEASVRNIPIHLTGKEQDGC